MTNLAKDVTNVGMGALGVIIALGLLLEYYGINPGTVNRLAAQSGQFVAELMVVGFVVAIVGQYSLTHGERIIGGLSCDF